MKKRELMQTARALLRALEAVPEKDRVSAVSAYIAELKRQGRILHGPTFLRVVERTWNELHGPETVLFTSAHRVPTALKEKIEEILPNAELKSVIDPRLLGGATLHLDDRVIDGSVGGIFERMKKALLAH